MSNPVADYHEERAAFDALLQSRCEQRILFFHGESGTGKTTLLSNCRDRVKAATHSLYVNIDLKGTAVTVGEILSRTSDRLNASRLPTLKHLVNELAGIPEVDLDDVTQTGFRNKINITLQVNDPNDREQRRVALTEALFADFKELAQPVVFIFDTYQEATTEVKDWIGGPFLARVESVSQIRVVIAGQNVPDANNIDWGHCCVLRQLKGVPKPEHWIPVVEEMGLRVPGTDPLSWLNPICDFLKGRPSDIMNYLKAHQEKGSSL